MRDYIIREAFHKTVLKYAHCDSSTFVVDELGLKNGEIRADIAVLNGKLVGYEIKTENDTLSRLPSQVQAYSEVFDKAYIIISENHYENAIQIIPEWWGIYLIQTGSTGTYSFITKRKSKVNKKLCGFSLAQLLWKQEAFSVASEYLQYSLKSKTTKHEAYAVISEGMTSKKLSKLVIQYLKLRENWRKDRIQPL